MIHTCPTWFDAHRARAAVGLRGVYLILLVFLSLPVGSHAEGFVPTGLGGSLSYGYGYSRVRSGESETTMSVLSTNMSGFFWEPWFITSDFGLGLGLSESESSNAAAVISRSISGSGDFTLFPLSRFPTTFGFSVSDSRQELKESPNVDGAAFQMRRFYLRQIYNSPQGWTMGGYYNQSSVLIVDSDKESIERSFGLEARHRFSHHDLEFDFTYFVNEPADASVEFRTSNTLFSHSYFPSTEVGVSTTATYSTSDTKPSTTNAEYNYTQASSSYYWRPEHRPYFFSGGVRVFQAETGDSSRGVNTNANANYRMTRNITFSAGLTVSVSDYSGAQSTDSTQSVSASYFSDSFSFVGFEYGWGFSSSASNSVSRSDQAQVGSDPDSAKDIQSISASASHRVARSWSFGKTASANLGLAQSVSKSVNTASEDSPINISNSMSTGFSHSGFGGTSSVNFAVSDTRSVGTTESEFQVASLVMGRVQEVSRLSVMSVNLSAQASRSRSLIGAESPEPQTRTSRSAAASVSYGHSRFLGVRNLTFNSHLSFPSLIQQDTPAAQTAVEWSNSFNYSMGLLQSSLVVRTTESENNPRTYNASFQVLRTF